jgi:hypothetical protein
MISAFWETDVRALFPPVLVSSIFLAAFVLAAFVLAPFVLAPLACGHPLQPAPAGSTPSDKSIVLTFASSADRRSSYVVDYKGFYEPNFAPSASNSGIGTVGSDDGAGTRGSSPASVLAEASNSKGMKVGSAGLSALAGPSGSSGGGIAGAGSSSGSSQGSGFFGSRNVGQGANLGAGGKGLGLFAVLPDSETNGLSPEPEDFKDPGPSVSATPLPASWTMMLIGLLAFGLLSISTAPMRRQIAHTSSFAAE